MKKIILIVSMMFCFVGFAHAKEDYEKILNQYTRSDKVFRKEDLKAAIIWNATMINPHLIEAMANKKMYQYKLKEEGREKEKKNIEEKVGNNLAFFISFYSGDKQTEDLLNKESGWDLRLEAGGRYFRPVAIEKIEKIKPIDKFYYPYLDQWSKGYYVSFSNEAELYPKPWVLSVHGTEQNSRLIWK